MDKQKEKKPFNNSGKGLLHDLGIAVLTGIITDAAMDGMRLFSTMNESVISMTEWNPAYNKIHELIYKMAPEKYMKHKVPSTNKQYYELELGTSYFIRRKDVVIRVEQFKESSDNSLFTPSHKLKLTFFGKKKYQTRMEFLQYAMKATDKDSIKVKYLGANNRISNKIITHDFDHIVLEEGVKSRILNGLKGWKNSNKWYKDHQMVHKIGIFLYGEPGTGKSSVARAISNLFNNAPILTIDASDVMRSIEQIVEQRKKYDQTIIVLIEDFDMFFKSREEVEGVEEDINIKKTKDFNQNAIFQLLDGMYSTDDTIYVATTNHRDRIDPALIRHGRFDIQEELTYFSKEMATKAIQLLGFDESLIDSLNIKFPVQPSALQSKILEYRSDMYNK